MPDALQWAPTTQQEEVPNLYPLQPVNEELQFFVGKLLLLLSTVYMGPVSDVTGENAFLESLFAALVIVLQKSKSCNLWIIIKLYVLRLLNIGPVGYWTRSFLVLVVTLKLDLCVPGSPFCTA